MSGVRGMRHGHSLPDDELEPCGTLAAYRRHLRRGDPVDRDCQEVNARAWQDRIAAGWERAPRRSRTHAATRTGSAACGQPGKVAVTGDPGQVTCGHMACRHAARWAEERPRAAT